MMYLIFFFWCPVFLLNVWSNSMYIRYSNQGVKLKQMHLFLNILTLKKCAISGILACSKYYNWKKNLPHKKWPSRHELIAFLTHYVFVYLHAVGGTLYHEKNQNCSRMILFFEQLMTTSDLNEIFENANDIISLLFK